MGHGCGARLPIKPSRSRTAIAASACGRLCGQIQLPTVQSGLERRRFGTHDDRAPQTVSSGVSCNFPRLPLAFLIISELISDLTPIGSSFILPILPVPCLNGSLASSCLTALNIGLYFYTRRVSLYHDSYELNHVGRNIQE